MIVKETRELDGTKYDCTYSDLSVYIQNEDGQRYEVAYDPLSSDIKYIETATKIAEETEYPDLDSDEFESFLDQYNHIFGTEEHHYSKYKIVKMCIEKGIWEMMKDMMEESYLKDLFDAAIEFMSADEFFIRGVYKYYQATHEHVLDIYEMLKTCES